MNDSGPFRANFSLASNPVWQELVREEIVGLQDCLADTEEVVSSVKLDSLACLNAHIKEILRFYPGVPIVNRIILEDMHITLAKPIPSKKGQDEIEQIFVEKGTRFHYNLAATRSIWGKDAGSFNPLSGLAKESPETEQESSNIPVGLGPYANLCVPTTCFGLSYHELTFLEDHLSLAELVSVLSQYISKCSTDPFDVLMNLLLAGVSREPSLPTSCS
ncbi:hypothetical protein EV361DRAFT_805521 [Lentinula raphanica]|uniref:Uncharacterized protein n=1 Tax=Lentinula raphanica TaxID=153919 RepID=A0AA38PG70_9AGAR|nr:hypothetical protein F5878DRAFT_530017 [Lentinula raphanica]KAJ3968502.1 hypothetical protein EV361DRAFT_805521 [Lentinula raphanica]